MTIVLEAAAAPPDPAATPEALGKVLAAASAGLTLTAVRLAEGAGLSELTIDHVLQGLRMGGQAVGGARKLSKERRIRQEKRRKAAREQAREEIARAARAAALAAEREAELEHERRLAEIRAGGAPRVG